MWSVCLCLSNWICIVNELSDILPFPVYTQEKLCIISKRPIYANIPLRALCFSRPFLSRFLVGFLSLLLGTTVFCGVYSFSLVLGSVLPHEYEQKWQAGLKRACCTFKICLCNCFWCHVICLTSWRMALPQSSTILFLQLQQHRETVYSTLPAPIINKARRRN